MKLGMTMVVKDKLDLLKPALESIQTRYPYQLILIDDHSNEETKAYLRSTPHKVFYDPPIDSLGGRWNLGMWLNMRAGATHLMLMNDDILLRRDCIDRLVERYLAGGVDWLDSNDIALLGRSIEELETMQPGTDDKPGLAIGCAIASKEVIERVGWFDENFKMYFEDNDYHTRLVLAGMTAKVYEGALYYHYGSMTIKRADDAGKAKIQAIYNDSLNYFISKWGKPPSRDEVEILDRFGHKVTYA